MPKLQHNFVQGKMNKDLDERLVPNGQYRDALNIQVSTSEGSDVGAIENVLGNTKQNKKTASLNWDANFGLTSPECIGVAKDTLNDKLYWFITASNGDAILEYDQSTGFIVPVIVDTRATSVLNFSASYKITGINILEGMLFWTDNNNEPRKLNISDYKTAAGTSVGASATSLSGAAKTTEIYSRDFLASDITVIKPAPKQAVTISAKSTKTAASPERGVGVTPVSVLLKLTDSNAHPLSSGDTVVAVGTITPYISPSSVFNNKDVRLSHTAIKSDGTKIKYEAIATMSSLTAGEQPSQFNGATFTIKSVSSNVPNSALEWDLVLIESDPIFKNDFPRFSYRWKYVDGEYSTYAPFSQAAFVPGKYDYEAENGYNLGMNDNIRKITLTFPTDSYATPPKDVKEIEILYKGVGSNNVYVVDTHLTADGTLSTFDIEKKLLGPVVESLQLLRLYDDVPRKAQAQEIIGNRVVYGNYLHNYTLGDVATITATTTGTAFTNAQKYFGQKSVKSDRTYQLGITFLDEFNRESPVFTNKEAAIEVALEDSDKINKLSASTAMTTVPSWAEYYKYYVKESSPEYYNLILDRFYDAEDGNIWLSFPSAERNKIREGGFIILKKAHGSNDSVSIDNKYKIIDISNEAPDFIRNTNRVVSRTEIKGVDDFSGNDFTFTGPTPNTHQHFVDSIKGGNSVQFRTTSGDKTSALYKIKSGGPEGDADTSSNKEYKLSLVDEGFTTDDAWIENITAASTAIEMIVYEQSNDLLPEFQGKFFVKVPRNASFENDIAAGIGLSQYVSVIHEATVEDDLNTVQKTSTSSRLAFGNTVTDSSFTTNYPSGTTFDLHIYNSWIDEDDASDYRDLHRGVKGAVFDAIEIGSRIRFKNSDGDLGQVYSVTAVTASDETLSSGGIQYDFERKIVTVDRTFADNLGSNPTELDLQIVEAVEGSVNATSNPAIFETEPLELADLDIYYEATDALEISGLANSQDLDFKNCYSFGNGVESDRIRDDFNAPLLGKGVRVSTVLQTPYEEERLPASLIYSGIVNTRSGVNNSNQFTTAIDITKDLPNTYGSIQKLHARDTDLITLCEDKCFRVLANKDALFNADGNTNVTSSNNVLGQTIPYAGEFGISKNPETFASYGFRTYFTDKSRGTVLRLSADGLTEIAEAGMSDYFEDKFKSHSGAIIGSYDEASGTYNVSFSSDESVAFKEGVNGWPSRLSFTPEFAVSLNNEYYTIKNGELWEHSNTTRSNFYGTQEDTTVTLLINDAPSSVKNFKTLAYEGDSNWTAAIDTDQQDGTVSSWKKREGFYYNFISGKATTISNMDTSELAVQGLGDLADDGTFGGGGYDLEINGSINTALQIGDAVYRNDGSTNTALGNVASINRSTNTISTTTSPVSPTPDAGDYLFFVKDTEKNTSGLIGYYGEVKMSTSSGDKKELFAVNSEVFISSE